MTTITKHEEAHVATVEELVGACQRARDIVRVNGAVVHLSELSGEDVMALPSGQDFTFRLLARTIVNARGQRIFGDEPADIAKIKAMGSRSLRKLTRAAIALNGLDEETEKNSAAGSSAG